jgi:hypothetical protein
VRSGAKYIIFIAIFIISCLFFYLFKNNDPVESLMEKAKPHDTLNSFLPQLVSKHFIQLLYKTTNEDSAKFLYDVDNLIYELCKTHKPKTIIATINEYPATVWRLSDNDTENNVIFDGKSLVRKELLLKRKKSISESLKLNVGNMRYFSIYETTKNVPNMHIFCKNILLQNFYNVLTGIEAKSEMRLGVFYFIFLNNDVYVFAEYGGTQLHNDNIKNTNPKILSYKKFQYDDFVLTKYNTFIETELGFSLESFLNT